MLALFILALLAGCGQPEPESHQFTGGVMGTTYHVRVIAPSLPDPELGVLVHDSLEGVNQAMTTYNPGSELMRLNAAPVDQWVSVSEPLAEVLAISAEVWRDSGGAFDPTVGRLVNLWGFGPDEEDHDPDAQTIQAALANVGYQYLEQDTANHRVRKQRDIFIDLSAVAKGYAVDVLARQLEAHGMHDYLVEVGGEVRASGLSARKDPWRVAIEKPVMETGTVQAALRITQGSMATSGDYRNFRPSSEGVISHEINPVTGHPARNHLASVTVVHNDCARADAWATAFMAMGEEKARALASERGLAVYLLVRAQDALVPWVSPAMQVYVETGGNEP